MDLKLHATQQIRVKTGNENNFIDVDSGKDEICLGVSLHPSFHYIEIRKKGGHIKIFLFEKKGHKKYFDFGYWNDAEVVYANNEVLKTES